MRDTRVNVKWEEEDRKSPAVSLLSVTVVNSGVLFFCINFTPAVARPVAVHRLAVDLLCCTLPNLSKDACSTECYN